ncbi:YebG family protein [Idiomarina xiamenensis]|uniref:Damage-inducible protein n=1 Tax=Idiomarina xiamenensis 10-D-4 TaxID=740709 RepID=K2KKA9_9GAMM|nr:YebG family protein [Idiomarina xiamenensis]EKE87062.1 hypothetical protein A10D4_02432 [Idiomarina xiamenensis 10-D-4]
MAVVTQYVVVREGAEVMTFTSKAEADAHDKMLDMAEALQPLLEQSELLSDERSCEALSIFLAKQREDVLVALGAKKKPTKKAGCSKANSSKASTSASQSSKVES